MRVFLSVGSLVVAVALGRSALLLYLHSILPWLRAPQTTHVTCFIAGLPFTGWQLFVPVGVMTVAALILTFTGLWCLKRGGETSVSPANSVDPELPPNR